MKKNVNIKLILVFLIIWFSELIYSDIFNIETDKNVIVFLDADNNVIPIKKEIFSKNVYGNKEGRVLIETNDGYNIEGTYNNGLLEGILKGENNKGETFNINFTNNFKNGQFLKSNLNSSYEFNYNYDKLNGKYIVKFKDSEIIYNYVNGEKIGREIIKINEIGTYQGNVYNDKRVGKYTFKFLDGNYLEGYFNQDLLTGPSVTIMKNGDKIYINYVLGVQVGKIIAYINGEKKIFNNLIELKEYDNKYIKYITLPFEKKKEISIESKEEDYFKSIYRENENNIFTFKYRYNSDDFIDGILQVAFYENKKLQTVIEIEYKNGIIEGKYLITDFKEGCKTKLNFEKNTIEGKFYKECIVSKIESNYKDSMLDGEELIMDKLSNLEIKNIYQKGILIKSISKIENIIKESELKGDDYYINEYADFKNLKLKHNAIIKGNYEIHELFTNNKLEKYEGKSKDIPNKVSLLDEYIKILKENIFDLIEE